ncbi:MAG: hypothetical protein NTU54_01705 [Candidatus Omnitrophica bacterium]|nr:hypothetical protein [Candidatus Omnitrophota bacterium]
MVNKEPGMTLITKTVTRLTVGLIIIYAFYVAAQGNLGPGSAFAGGMIIALSFIHLMLAFGKEAALARLDQVKGIFLCSLGAIVFLFFAALEARDLKINIIANFALSEIAVAVMVGTGLFMIFLALVLLVGGTSEK